MIIGIEGPAGSGKSTMARMVAAEIGAVVIEGGALYRALAYESQRRSIPLTEVSALVELAKNLKLTMQPGSSGHTHYLINDEDVTDKLYTEEISGIVATVSQHLPVREVIESIWSTAARAHESAIIVGRHLKRALPEAAVLRLEISPEEAERRHDKRAGTQAPGVSGRNEQDRQTALKQGLDQGKGVTIVDVDGMTVDEQADLLREFIARVPAVQQP